jgi:hypothetical protein
MANKQETAKAIAARGGKILRLGLILGDKIVEEQLIRDRKKPVTIGQSAKNTFAIPAVGLPKTWSLFEQAGGRYVLRISESMDGRISDGNDVSTLAQLRGGRAQKVGDHWLLPLSESARGKILLGDVSILFQFVQAPPLQPRPQLPHSVRGSFADRIDPYLAVIVAISLMAHTGLYVHYKFFVDEPKPPPPDVIPDQFARVLVEAPRPPEPAKPSDKGEAPAAEEEKGQEQAKDDKPKGEKKDDPKPAEPQTAEAKVASTAPVRVLKQLSGKGGSGAPLLGPGDDKEAWGDLGKGLGKVGSGDVVAGVGTTTGQTTRGTGDGEVAVGTGQGVSGPTGPGTTSSGPKQEEEVKVAGSQGKIEDIDSAGLDPDKVSATIRSRYYPRVVQCYQRALKSNPSLGGKVNVTFTVGVAGNVVKVDADGFDGGVDSCIEAEARRWRFDRPEGQATFEISFVLRRA